MDKNNEEYKKAKAEAEEQVRAFEAKLKTQIDLKDREKFLNVSSCVQVKESYIEKIITATFDYDNEEMDV